MLFGDVEALFLAAAVAETVAAAFEVALLAPDWFCR